MEDHWNGLIAQGWTNLSIRPCRNTDPENGDITYTYAVSVGTPLGTVIIENGAAEKALRLLALAMTGIGGPDDYKEEPLSKAVQSSQLDARERNAKRELDDAHWRNVNQK